MKKIFLFSICIFSLLTFSNSDIYDCLKDLLRVPYKQIKQYQSNKIIKAELPELEAKVKKTPPSWFLAQMKEDFSHISNLPITKSNIDETYENLRKLNDAYHYLRIKITDNKLSVLGYDNLQVKERADAKNRADAIIGAINTIGEIVALPNVDFIVSLGDSVSFNLSKYKAPIFTFASNKNHAENRILIPDSLTLISWPLIYYEILEINKEIPWEKKINKAYWRGATTGALFDDRNYYRTFTSEYTINNYFLYPRTRLVQFSVDHQDLIDAQFYAYPQTTEEARSTLNEKYRIAGKASKKDHLQYKIQVSLDGNTCTYPGYVWRLLSNSIVLKEDSDDRQWFYSIFKPWEHYIPIKADMSDLKDKLEWVRAYDIEAKKMAERAGIVVQQNLKISDMYWYILVLLQEYSKLQE